MFRRLIYTVIHRGGHAGRGGLGLCPFSVSHPRSANRTAPRLDGLSLSMYRRSGGCRARSRREPDFGPRSPGDPSLYWVEPHPDHEAVFAFVGKAPRRRGDYDAIGYARRLRHELSGQLVTPRCVKQRCCTQELGQGVPWSIHSRVSVMNFS